STDYVPAQCLDSTDLAGYKERDRIVLTAQSRHLMKRKIRLLLAITTVLTLWNQAHADSANWELMSPKPIPRSIHAIAYDVARGRTVMFGGWDSDHILADTWEWDGTNWTQQTPATSPPARAGHSLAYDSARGRVVLFGGCASTVTVGAGDFLADTWEWDGTTWIQMAPATSPSPRCNYGMAYDAIRKR